VILVRGRGRTTHHVRLSPIQRSWIYGIIGCLWLTGCAWLILDRFFTRHGPFGPTPHPWESPLLLAHGVIAILSARHVFRWWPAGVRRWSGGGLAAFMGILAASGFALFFLTDDRWLHYSAVSHDAFGLVVTVFAIRHWFFRRLVRNGPPASRIQHP
jgi:hypothetical protein